MRPAIYDVSSTNGDLALGEQDKSSYKINKLKLSDYFQDHVFLIVESYGDILMGDSSTDVSALGYSESPEEVESLAKIVKILTNEDAYQKAKEGEEVSLRDLVACLSDEVSQSITSDALGRLYLANTLEEEAVLDLVFPLPYLPKFLQDPQTRSSIKPRAYFTAQESVAIHDFIQTYRDLGLKKANSHVTECNQDLDDSFKKLLELGCLNEALFCLYHQENINNLDNCSLNSYLENFLDNIQESLFYKSLSPDNQNALHSKLGGIETIVLLVANGCANLETNLKIDAGEQVISALTVSYLNQSPIKVQESFQRAMGSSRGAEVEFDQDDIGRLVSDCVSPQQQTIQAQDYRFSNGAGMPSTDSVIYRVAAGRDLSQSDRSAESEVHKELVAKDLFSSKSVSRFFLNPKSFDGVYQKYKGGLNRYRKLANSINNGEFFLHVDGVLSELKSKNQLRPENFALLVDRVCENKYLYNLPSLIAHYKKLRDHSDYQTHSYYWMQLSSYLNVFERSLVDLNASAHKTIKTHQSAGAGKEEKDLYLTSYLIEEFLEGIRGGYSENRRYLVVKRSSAYTPPPYLRTDIEGKRLFLAEYHFEDCLKIAIAEYYFAEMLQHLTSRGEIKGTTQGCYLPREMEPLEYLEKGRDGHNFKGEYQHGDFQIKRDFQESDHAAKAESFRGVLARNEITSPLVAKGSSR